MAPYDHVVSRVAVYDGRSECLRCGTPTTGSGLTLRHVGEEFRPTQPAMKDALGFAAAVRIARDAQTHLPDDVHAGPDDIARAVVEELYRRGALRPDRTEWRPPRLIAA